MRAEPFLQTKEKSHVTFVENVGEFREMRSCFKKSLRYQSKEFDQKLGDKRKKPFFLSRPELKPLIDLLTSYGSERYP